MAIYTNYKSLEKPLSTEKYNVAVANKNNDVIDSELHKLDLKNQSQDELLATKESLNSEITRATTKENDIIEDLASEIVRAKSAENSNADDISNEATRALIAEENINTTLQNHISDESNPHHVTKEQIDLCNVDNTSDTDKPVSTAQQNALDSALSTHNTSDSSHNDMRLLISELTTRLNALADSDDTTLDQLSEIVAYIKNNKSLIDGITTSKVNISDIIDDLTTNSGDKVLSAKQGIILKGLITDVTSAIPTKISQLENDSGYKTTDNNTWRGIQNNLNSDSTIESLAAAQGKALNEKKVNKSGDIITGQLTVKEGIKIHSSSAREGSAYLKLATFKISGAYTDSPISLEITRRSQKSTCKLFITFQNINNNDPPLSSFLADSVSDYGVYLFKKATSTWELYVTCPRYDQIDVIAFNIPCQSQTINITWLDENVSEIPSVAIKATLLRTNNSSIVYSDSQPTSLSVGMTWIGN